MKTRTGAVGAIFVQTICDYPLVEAIKQNVVKSPVLPDEASRQKIHEKDSRDFVERYYIPYFLPNTVGFPPITQKHLYVK